MYVFTKQLSNIEATPNVSHTHDEGRTQTVEKECNDSRYDHKLIMLEETKIIK